MHDDLEKFKGVAGKAFSGYVEYKRAIGQSCGKSIIAILFNIYEYITQEDDSVHLTQTDAEAILSMLDGKSSGYRHTWESILRQLGLYLERCGYKDIYILPEKLTKAVNESFPYILTGEEMSMIYKYIDDYRPARSSMATAWFYRVFVRLLYSTGLRLNEALSLRCEDVDLDNRFLTVIGAKGNTSRIVPYSESLHGWLLNYAKSHKDGDEFFFESPCGGKRSKAAVQKLFKKRIFPGAGITGTRKCHPTIHSFRHTFACEALSKSINDGKDPLCVLPYLATYLGHKDLKSTEIYLHLTEEHFKEITDAGHHIYEGVIDCEE